MADTAQSSGDSCSKNNEGEEGYDRETQEPALRCSICTGEQVAGFRDRKTGHFEEVALIRKEQDLEEFRRRYGIDGEIPKFY